MDKLLIICGQTATGKTKLAQELAKRFNGELVSADSRQLYKGLDIISGKDLPKSSHISKVRCSATFHHRLYDLCSYDINGVLLWMYDVVNPNEEFSVAHYRVLALAVIDNMRKRGKLPIIVGGTGLYISSLVQNIDTVHVPRNNEFRTKLNKDSPVMLQENLRNINYERWQQMNESDRNNPRRLIRAIEVAVWENAHEGIGESSPFVDTCWIGLTLSQSVLAAKIKKRVEARCKGGAGEEVRRLSEKDLSSQLPSLSSLGITYIQEYINGSLSRNDVIEKWTKQEIQYAKRPITWFKKQTGIQWVNAGDEYVYGKVEALVREWYTKPKNFNQ